MICVSEQTIKTSSKKRKKRMVIHTLIQVQGTDPRITVGLTLHVSRWCEAVAATSCALLWADRCFRCRSLLGTARGSSHSQPDTPGTSGHFLLFCYSSLISTSVVVTHAWKPPRKGCWPLPPWTSLSGSGRSFFHSQGWQTQWANI